MTTTTRFHELREHKATHGNPLTLTPGVWHTTDTIHLPGGRDYLTCVQVRNPAGVRIEKRLARIGWGAEATRSRADTTGHHTFREDSVAYSDGHTHPLAGGGPLAFQLRVTRVPKGHRGGVLVPTVVVKAVGL